MVSETSKAFPPRRAALYLYVAHAEHAAERAVLAGGEKIMDVDDMPYGDRQGGVRAPAGDIWWISQRLSAKPYF